MSDETQRIEKLDYDNRSEHREIYKRLNKLDLSVTKLQSEDKMTEHVVKEFMKNMTTAIEEIKTAIKPVKKDWKKDLLTICSLIIAGATIIGGLAAFLGGKIAFVK